MVETKDYYYLFSGVKGHDLKIIAAIPKTEVNDLSASQVRDIFGFFASERRYARSANNTIQAGGRSVVLERSMVDRCTVLDRRSGGLSRQMQ